MKRVVIFVCLLILKNACPLKAQDFGPLADGFAKMKSVVSKFSESVPQFTAVFHYQVFDAQSVPKKQMMMEMMMTEDKMRVDLLVMTLSQIPAEQRTVMKTLQMDRIVLITQLESKKMYLTFPGLGVFQEFPIKDETLAEITTRSRNVSFQKTELGQEIVFGHPCTKTMVEATETNRPPEKAIVWYANDLKQFPLRIAMGKDNLLHAFEFKNVQLVSPNPTLFEAPTNYTRLENTAEVFRIAKERFQAGGGSLPATPPNGQPRQ